MKVASPILNRHHVAGAVLALALVIAVSAVPALVWLPLSGLGLLALMRLGRSVDGGRALVAILVIAFVLRVGLGLGLFYVSALNLPVAAEFQMGNGFWTFAADARDYHRHAVHVVRLWEQGADADEAFRDEAGQYYTVYRGLSVVLALVYWALGPLAPNFIIVNAWLGAATALLAYVLARGIGGRDSGIAAATILAFWPSGIVWSTQLLRDTLTLLMLLLVFVLVMRLGEYVTHPGASLRRPIALVSLAGLTACAGAVTVLRYYVGFAVFAGASGALLWHLAGGLHRRQSRQLVSLSLTVFMIGLGVFTAHSVDPLRLVDPVEETPRPRIDGPAAAEPEEPAAAPRQEPAAATQRSDPLRHVAEAIRRAPDQLNYFTGLLSVDVINSYRKAVIGTGGRSLADPDKKSFDGWLDLLLYAPRAVLRGTFWPLSLALLGQFETQTGIGYLALPESALLVLAAPFVLWGCARARAGPTVAVVILMYSLTLAVPLCLVVDNLGTLFRLRLMYALPLLILAVSCTPAASYVSDRSRRALRGW